MGSRHPPRPYDKATLTALEQAFSDAWAVLEARDPLRDWVKDGQLSSVEISYPQDAAKQYLRYGSMYDPGLKPVLASKPQP